MKILGEALGNERVRVKIRLWAEGELKTRVEASWNVQQCDL